MKSMHLTIFFLFFSSTLTSLLGQNFPQWNTLPQLPDQEKLPLFDAPVIANFQAFRVQLSPKNFLLVPQQVEKGETEKYSLRSISFKKTASHIYQVILQSYRGVHYIEINLNTKKLTYQCKHEGLSQTYSYAPKKNRKNKTPIKVKPLSLVDRLLQLSAKRENKIKTGKFSHYVFRLTKRKLNGYYTIYYLKIDCEGKKFKLNFKLPHYLKAVLLENNGLAILPTKNRKKVFTLNENKKIGYEAIAFMPEIITEKNILFSEYEFSVNDLALKNKVEIKERIDLISNQTMQNHINSNINSFKKIREGRNSLTKNLLKKFFKDYKYEKLYKIKILDEYYLDKEKRIVKLYEILFTSSNGEETTLVVPIPRNYRVSIFEERLLVIDPGLSQSIRYLSQNGEEVFLDGIAHLPLSPLKNQKTKNFSCHQFLIDHSKENPVKRSAQNFVLDCIAITFSYFSNERVLEFILEELNLEENEKKAIHEFYKKEKSKKKNNEKENKRFEKLQEIFNSPGERKSA